MMLVPAMLIMVMMAAMVVGMGMTMGMIVFRMVVPA